MPQILWHLPLLYISNLLRVYSNPVYTNKVSHVLNLRFEELTIRGLSVQLMLPQQVEYLSQMLLVFLNALGEHKDVIQVNEDKHIVERKKNVVHQPLESSRSIYKTQTQHAPLEVTKWRTQSSLGHIVIRHTDLVVSLCQV